MIANPANDIFKQAHQGSVAAIIQVLNDKLADSGVRTRAIFTNGVLQLLCEAPTAEALEQTELTDRIRKTLESIAPRNIRRVNINCRIVREQQLLWLDEIYRDPENQLLWSQEIILKNQNFIQRSIEDWKEAFSNKDDFRKPLSAQAAREKRQFAKGIFGGLALSAGVLAAGWGVYAWQTGQLSGSPAQLASATQSKFLTQNSSQSAPQDTKLAQDPFAVAVRTAEKAAETGRSAQTPESRKSLAEMWGKASDLMASVPPSDKRYAIAQDRTTLYRKYKEAALEKAK